MDKVPVLGIVVNEVFSIFWHRMHTRAGGSQLIPLTTAPEAQRYCGSLVLYSTNRAAKSSPTKLLASGTFFAHTHISSPASCLEMPQRCLAQPVNPIAETFRAMFRSSRPSTSATRSSRVRLLNQGVKTNTVDPYLGPPELLLRNVGVRPVRRFLSSSKLLAPGRKSLAELCCRDAAVAAVVAQSRTPDSKRMSGTRNTPVRALISTCRLDLVPFWPPSSRP